MKHIHKLNALAASIAVATSGSVFASNMETDEGISDLTEIFVGGATAPQNFMREDLMLRICSADPAVPGAPGTIQVFVDEVETVPSHPAAGTILEQGDHFVVRCDVPAGATGTAVDGSKLAVYKLNGGSSTGVAPVVDPAGASANSKTYLDASAGASSSCVLVDSAHPTHGAGGSGLASATGTYPISTTGFSYELYECAGAGDLKVQDPDGGVSDVEPTLFVGSLALDFGSEPSGVTAKPTQAFVDLGNIDVKAGPGLIFGTAVTLPMYDELVDDQTAGTGACPAAPTRGERDSLACMPSLPKSLVTSVFTGQVTSWADVAPYGNALDTSGVDAGDDVSICKRTNGSGTHAQFSVEFLGTNCTATSSKSMLEVNEGVASAAFGLVGVYANRGSSDMDDCLRALGSGTGFDGDFDGLPPTSFADTGDSSVVPGSGLSGVPGGMGANPNNPLIATYDTANSAFAMGYNSLEKNTSFLLPYRFVRINGAAPSLEDAVAGDYTDIYYLSYQHRVAGGQTDRNAGAIRTAGSDHGTEQAEVDGFFSIWNATAPAAIDAVNATLTTTAGWQGGFLSPLKGAAFAYGGSAETPWVRQNAAGAQDSCQNLSLVR